MFKNKETINPEQVDTVVGEATEINGKLSGTGSLRIDGRVDGEIEIEGDLIVGEKGRVQAQVKAKNVSIAGYVQGDVTASGRLEILPTGRLEGNAKVGTLVIEEGAGFRGQCEMAIADSGEGKRVARLFGNSHKEEDTAETAE